MSLTASSARHLSSAAVASWRSSRCSTCNLGVIAARSTHYYNWDMTSFHATEARRLRGKVEGWTLVRAPARGIYWHLNLINHTANNVNVNPSLMVPHLFSHLSYNSCDVKAATASTICLLTSCKNMAKQYGHLRTGGATLSKYKLSIISKYTDLRVSQVIVLQLKM